MGMTGARLPRRTRGYVPKHVMRRPRRRLASRALVALLPALLAATFVGAVSSPDRASAAGVPYQVADVFAGVGNGQIKHFSSTGVQLDTLNNGTGSFEQTGMAFDPAGNLYSTNFSAGSASKFNNSGTLLGAFGSFTGSPESIVRDQAGNFYVGQVNGSTEVRKFNAAGNLLATFSPAIEDRGTDWIDLAADQCTLFYTSEGALIKRFNVCTNTQLPDFGTSPNGGFNFALRIRPNGEVLVAATTAVYRFNSAGAVIQTYPFPSNFLFALNLDPDGTTFWTGDINTGAIFRVNIASGAVVTTFNSAPFSTMAGLAVFGEITVAQDTTRPSCTIARSGTTTNVTFRDTGSGLAAINVLGTRNATATVPPFTAGTTNPVTATLNRVNVTQPGSVRLRARDVQGNIAYCTLSGWVAT